MAALLCRIKAPFSMPWPWQSMDSTYIPSRPTDRGLQSICKQFYGFRCPAPAFCVVTKHIHTVPYIPYYCTVLLYIAALGFTEAQMAVAVQGLRHLHGRGMWEGKACACACACVRVTRCVASKEAAAGRGGTIIIIIIFIFTLIIDMPSSRRSIPSPVLSGIPCLLSQSGLVCVEMEGLEGFVFQRSKQMIAKWVPCWPLQLYRFQAGAPCLGLFLAEHDLWR
jgi:hypothetical protein